VEVRPIQSNLRFFLLNKKAHVFERACIVAKKGPNVPFLREICPLKKRTPFFCPVNGAIAWKLLTQNQPSFDHPMNQTQGSSTKQSDVTTSQLDRVSVIPIHYQIFWVFRLNIEIFTSFYTSWVRFPTDAQLFRAIIKRQGLISSKGVAHKKQLSLIFTW
jgi:hypothetical protein